MFIKFNVYYDVSHNDIACISLSLTPFGESPYVCMHDMRVSTCTCMWVHMDKNIYVCVYNILHECECAYAHALFVIIMWSIIIPDNF